MNADDQTDSNPAGLSEHVEKNRVGWEARSDSYEQEHAAVLSGDGATGRKH